MLLRLQTDDSSFLMMSLNTKCAFTQKLKLITRNVFLLWFNYCSCLQAEVTEVCLENKKYEYVSFKMNFNHSSLDYRDSKSTGIISRDIHTTQPINQ